MNSITQHYIIDLSSNNNFVQVPAVQGDGNTSRYIEVELIENGVQYVLNKDDDYITIAGTKPDGTEIWNICDISEEGYIIVEITYQMTAVVGRSTYEIMIVERGQNNQLKSFPFFIQVTAASYDPGYIISSNEFEALAQYTSAAEVAAESAAKSAEDAALAGTVGVFRINYSTSQVDGHLYFEKIDSWRGNFAIVDGTNLQVTWE